MAFSANPVELQMCRTTIGRLILRRGIRHAPRTQGEIISRGEPDDKAQPARRRVLAALYECADKGPVIKLLKPRTTNTIRECLQISLLFACTNNHVLLTSI